MICDFASSCLALVIRDTDASRRHNDGSRRHTDGSHRHIDVSRRHTDDRVSHFRQICIRYIKCYVQNTEGTKVHFKRLDLRFLEIGVLRVIITKRDPEFPGISGQVV
eukprot:sb/3477637/